MKLNLIFKKNLFLGILLVLTPKIMAAIIDVSTPPPVQTNGLMHALTMHLANTAGDYNEYVQPTSVTSHHSRETLQMIQRLKADLSILDQKINSLSEKQVSSIIQWLRKSNSLPRTLIEAGKEWMTLAIRYLNNRLDQYQNLDSRQQFLPDDMDLIRDSLGNREYKTDRGALTMHPDDLKLYLRYNSTYKAIVALSNAPTLRRGSSRRNNLDGGICKRIMN